MIKHRSEPRTLCQTSFVISIISTNYIVSMPFGKCKHLHHAKLQSWSNVFLKRQKHKRFWFMTLQCKKKPDCAKPIDKNDRSTCACNSSDKMYIIMFIGNVHSRELKTYLFCPWICCEAKWNGGCFYDAKTMFVSALCPLISQCFILCGLFWLINGTVF